MDCELRLVLVTDGADRWAVWHDETEDTAGLLESSSHLHLVGRAELTVHHRLTINTDLDQALVRRDMAKYREHCRMDQDLLAETGFSVFCLCLYWSFICVDFKHTSPPGLTSLAWSRHRPTTAPPLPGNFTAEPNCNKHQRSVHQQEENQVETKS